MGKRLTNEEYIDRCKEKGYDLPVEDYVKATIKIKHKCPKGHIYSQTPSHHLKGQGCPICKGSFKKTPEQYAQECKEKGYDPPIEDYKGNKIKIKHKCKQGHIYLQKPENHLQGQGCPICYGNKKKSSDDYYTDCKEKGYDLPIEDYRGSDIPIEHVCIKCGKSYFQSPYSHYNLGRGCPMCGREKALINRHGKTRKKTPKEYVNECKEKGYDLPIEDYINNNTKIKHKCSKGHTYEQTPHEHLNGKGCKECYIIKRTSLENNKRNKTLNTRQGAFLDKCIQLGVDKPVDYSNYKNSYTKLDFKCSKGHIYEQAPDMHTTINRMTGCPICKESHGERFIRNYLEKNNINYTPQKKFNGLKDKDYLSYDFYLPDYNILIEYQGEQHYRPQEYFGGVSKFNKQQRHDNLKRKYAKDNGYKLLELHYSLDTQDKVDKYLERRIK